MVIIVYIYAFNIEFVNQGHVNFMHAYGGTLHNNISNLILTTKNFSRSIED